MSSLIALVLAASGVAAPAASAHSPGVRVTAVAQARIIRADPSSADPHAPGATQRQRRRDARGVMIEFD